MQTMYFIVVKGMLLNFYYARCEFMRYMRTPNMPVSNEYSAYTNRTFDMEFIQAAKEFYWEALKLSICKSPFFAILIDDSTDLTFEKHMIVYVTYLEDKGRGSPVYGASCIRGMNNGVLAKIRQKVSNIIGVHCIAHRESLVVSDACDNFMEFGFLDTFANKVHAWVGRSVQRHKELEKLLRVFSLKPLEVLRIHSVRWLSRGKVMKRLVTMMPALLHDFKENDVNFYKIAHFSSAILDPFMADVLVEMNGINKKFQDDHVDITEVGNALDVVIELFKKGYLGDTFGYGCKHFREFMRRLNANNELVYVQENGYVETHMLHFTSFSQNFTSGNSLQGCIVLAKSFVQELIVGIDARFNDLPLYNAAKLYSPTSFDKDISIRGQTHKVYLDHLCAKFGSSQNGLVDAFLCDAEVDEHGHNPSWRAIGYCGPAPAAVEHRKTGEKTERKPLEGRVFDASASKEGLALHLKEAGFEVLKDVEYMASLWKEDKIGWMGKNGRIINYALHPLDHQSLTDGGEAALRVLIAAGASEVGTNTRFGDRLCITEETLPAQVEDFLQCASTGH
ncbi:hypothetical protein L7F22_051656 [Adiantum nelumboides]|nr:hypothetical protein [Adiantum nelumboides]